MNSDRWQRVQAVFLDALERAVSERQAFVEHVCGEDAELKAEVLAMLGQDAAEGTIVDGGLSDIAARLIGGSRKSITFQDFGPYRLTKFLGEGGMGVVYLAEHKDTGKRVAIKILLDARLSPARRERFAAEQHILAKMNDRYIAQLYHADILADGTPWFAMEYVEGLRIDDYCRKRNCSVEERLRLFRALCEAVEAVHAQSFVHRDLKPSNVMVTEDGTPKLLDFGIGKALESPESSPQRTAPGLRLITIAYAAPEQLRGAPALFRTDVYALGVILYELLVDRHPFDLSKCTTGEAERIVLEQEPVKPSETARHNAGSPRATKAEWNDLDALVLKAMHKEAPRRYQSVEALARDIDHYLKSEPLEARPDSWSYKAGKFVRRNRRTVVAAAGVLALMVGLVTFYTLRLARARDAALSEAARTERLEKFILNLIQGGDEEVGPPEDLRVVTLLDRGVKDAQALNHDPAIQADLYQALATIFQSFGKFDRAETLLNSALDRRKSLFGPDSPEVADTLLHLGALRGDQDRLPDAERLVRQALTMDQRHLPPDHPEIAKAKSGLGQILERRGDNQGAVQILQEVVQSQSAKGETDVDYLASLNLLANAQFYLGHYAISDSLNQKVLTVDKRIHGDRHPDIADDLINLGNIQTNLEHYAEAERYFRQALEINQSWYGKDNPNAADAETYVAQSLARQNRDREAEDLFKHALVVFEQAYGEGPNRHLAIIYGELGKIAQKFGNFDDAETDFKKAAEIYASVNGEKHSFVAVELSNLAGVYRDEKQYARSEQTYRDVVQRLTKALPADHLDVGIAQIKLGQVLLAENRYQEAEGYLVAGCNILKKQSPTAASLRIAREDLVTVYLALKMPERAAQVRAELSATASKTSE